MTRICITGGPRTGKTTLATDLWEEDDLPHGIVRHTDDLIGLHDWSGASQVASEWLDAPGPWIIEGVAVSRALRKWRARHPGEPPPVDEVIFLHTPHGELTRGQLTMAKGVESVHAEIEPWLREHGVFTAHQYVAKLG